MTIFLRLSFTVLALDLVRRCLTASSAGVLVAYLAAAAALVAIAWGRS